MTYNTKHKALMISILMAGLLTAFATFLAQTPRKQTRSNKQASTRLPEKEKEQTARNRLSALLSTVGMNVGPALSDSDAPTFKELRIHWESVDKPGPAGLITAEQLAKPGLLTRMSLKARAGVLPRERSVELSTDQMLVVAVDVKEAVRWWRLIIDPRLVRAEVGRTAEMQSENYYLANVDFIVECPDDPLLKQLRFYRPVWDGKAFHLELLGAAPLE